MVLGHTGATNQTLTFPLWPWVVCVEWDSNQPRVQNGTSPLPHVGPPPDASAGPIWTAWGVTVLRVPSQEGCAPEPWHPKRHWPDLPGGGGHCAMQCQAEGHGHRSVCTGRVGNRSSRRGSHCPTERSLRSTSLSGALDSGWRSTPQRCSGGRRSLFAGDRYRLVALDTGGWSNEAVQFVDNLAAARSREAPVMLLDLGRRSQAAHSHHERSPRGCRRKEARYSKLAGNGGRARFVVLAGEVGGHFLDETAQFLRGLAAVKVWDVPQSPRGVDAEVEFDSCMCRCSGLCSLPP